MQPVHLNVALVLQRAHFVVNAPLAGEGAGIPLYEKEMELPVNDSVSEVAKSTVQVTCAGFWAINDSHISFSTLSTVDYAGYIYINKLYSVQ
jgi:hypothetical protein